MSKGVVTLISMKPNSIHRLSSHFSTAKLVQTVFSPNYDLIEDSCGAILDQYPDIKKLKKLHSRIITDQYLHSNPSIGIKLMRAYAACGETGVTRQVFDETPDKNIVFINVMIRSYMNNHLYHDAFLLYKHMSSYGVNPDHYTYPCILKSCSGSNNLWGGLQIHGSTVKVGLHSNIFVGNGLIAMYGKCGCLLEARQVLDEMPRRDVVSWNSLVAGYAQSARFDDALEGCREMELSGIKPDAATMASLLPAVTNTSSDNVLYVKELFVRSGKKCVVSWNVMIAVYMNNSMPAEAVDLYMLMEGQGIEPDSVSIASVLPACGDISALSLGKRIHEYVETKKLQPNLLLENALIDMYAKCGCLDDAREVFNKMKFRDVVSWTSMFSAYGSSGQGRDVLALFSKMLESGLSPDAISFVSVLSACSHAGLLEEGRYYFKLMTELKINPRIEHFTCMVDLLGRAGRVEEAYNFVRHMPMDPNESIWGALLGACHVHSKMTIGLIAADKLFQLAPQQSGYYVMLSNIYAKAGRWEDVTIVRSIMKRKGIKKMPGASNVELNNKVHTFLVGDKSHPQNKEIYQELEALVGKMKTAGYVPETDSALHDVEDEEKESHLAVHSEKLAIAFSILNTPPGTPIRITKNLRICRDCHVAAELISKITEREIIVRDTNRFHRFQYGVCSCGGYW